MIFCKVSPFAETDDVRRAVAAALWEAGFGETAAAYWAETALSRSPDEAVVGKLPPMVQLVWDEPELAVSAR
jgi:hypothetical protein